MLSWTTRLFSSGLGIRQVIQKDLLAAIKSKDTLKSTVLRQIQSELVKFEKSKAASDAGLISESDLIGVIRGCSDRWNKAINDYQSMMQGSSRKDDIQKMIEKETSELQIIRSYLPAPYEPREIEEIIESVVKAQDGPASLGPLIKLVYERLDKTRIGRKEVSLAVEQYLQKTKI